MKNNKILSATDIAEYLILKNSIISAFKLQKIIYFIYREYLIKNKNKKVLFNENFQAWINGPVIKEIYDFYKKIVADYWEIDNFIIRNKFLLNNKKFQKVEFYFIQNVYEKIKNIPLIYLINKSHDQAWKNARKGILSNQISNNFIDREDIYKTNIDYKIDDFLK